MFYLEVISACYATEKCLHLVHLRVLLLEMIWLHKGCSEPSPSYITVVRVNYTVVKGTKVFLDVCVSGEESKSTLEDPNKQEVFRTGVSAKSTTKDSTLSVSTHLNHPRP